jgi:hypothetical protein
MRIDAYDDAHFFKRIALNALKTGELAWNRDEGPVYGTTSQVFQVLAVLITAITSDYYILAVRALSVCSSIAAFALLVHLCRKLDRGLSAAMAFASPIVLQPLVTGMETSLTFLVIAAVLWIVFSERGRELPTVVLPLALGVLYLTRPDALLLALGIVVIVRWLPEPKRGLSEALVLALLLGSSLLVFEHYYGTPLPLPFYAKHVAFSPYDPHFIRVSNEARTIRFGLFLAFAFPLGLLALRSRERENLALIGSVLLFCGYHYFATIDVMGMHGRFYAPALPVLALASARGIANAGERSKLSGLEDALAAGAFIGLLAFTELLPKTTGFHLERLGTVFYVSFIKKRLCEKESLYSRCTTKNL